MEIRQFRVALKARRFDRPSHFYGDILGLPRLRSWEGSGSRGALFQAGPGVVEIRGRSRDSESDGRDEAFDYQGPEHKLTVTLIVPSAEQAYERLLLNDRNIPGGLLAQSDGSLAFETHDPDGVKLRLCES